VKEAQARGMGTVESCCGKRRPEEACSMPSRPLSALGNQYVTFQPEQQEMFIIKHKVWVNSTSFEVTDIAGNPWFRIEGKDAQWTGQKKLVLNTGVHHATIERKGRSWHLYVGSERRATIDRETSNGGTRFVVRVHVPPFPNREAHESAGNPEARLIVTGDLANMDYSFAEAGSRDNRRIARVDRSFGEGLTLGPENFSVQVASAVDVALIILVSIIIDACVNDGADADTGPEGGDTGRSGMTSNADSVYTGDWKPHNIDVAPPKPRDVPPLWKKGKTPRNG